MAGGQRLSREQLMEKLAALDREALHKLVWTVYWRGGAAPRTRIEELLEPAKAREAKEAAAAVDSFGLKADVGRFVELARSGAYMGGSREVSRKERSLWRVAFRRLLDDATRLVESGELEAGAPLLEKLLDLANDCRGVYLFHSEDAVSAMKLVFSDRVGILWRATLNTQGFQAFAARAAAQLIRWESPFGWTSGEETPLSEKETTLTSIVSEMVHGADSWALFARAYVQALDGLIAPPPAVVPKRSPRHWQEEARSQEHARAAERRTARLEELHALLIDVLAGSDAERLLDTIARHAALGGPERTFVAASLAARRGNLTEARTLIERCLAKLPGHHGFLAFAKQVGAELPPPRSSSGPTIVFVRR
jgi:hypothetical protein